MSNAAKREFSPELQAKAKRVEQMIRRIGKQMNAHRQHINKEASDIETVVFAMAQILVGIEDRLRNMELDLAGEIDADR